MNLGYFSFLYIAVLNLVLVGANLKNPLMFKVNVFPFLLSPSYTTNLIDSTCMSFGYEWKSILHHNSRMYEVIIRMMEPDEFALRMNISKKVNPSD